MIWTLSSEQQAQTEACARLQQAVRERQAESRASHASMEARLAPYPETARAATPGVARWTAALASRARLRRLSPEELRQAVAYLVQLFRAVEPLRQRWGFTPVALRCKEEREEWFNLFLCSLEMIPGLSLTASDLLLALRISRGSTQEAHFDENTFSGTEEETGERLLRLMARPHPPRSLEEWEGWQGEVLQRLEQVARSSREEVRLLFLPVLGPEFCLDLQQWLETDALRRVEATVLHVQLEQLLREMAPLYEGVASQYARRIEEMHLPEEEPDAPFYPISRTFGVEIECILPAPLGEEQRLRIAELLLWRLGIPTQRDQEQGYGCWTVKTDSSVRTPTSGASGRGLELASPVLFGVEGQRELRRVLAALRAIGAQVNTSCGTHVHLGVPELIGPAAHPRQKALLRNYGVNEARINQLMTEDRCRGGYGGEPYLDHTSPQALRSSREAQERLFAEPEPDPEAPVSFAMQKAGALSKQAKVKMTKLAGPTGSVEFRQLQGTLEADLILEWLAAMCFLTDAAVQAPEQLALLRLVPGAERFHLHADVLVPDPLRLPLLELSAA